MEELLSFYETTSANDWEGAFPKYVDAHFVSVQWYDMVV